ncbi:hypothetical protein AX17_006187 [Amanita inopinata Kibby_2008]|nr:hypothetical protein AX17_006187 [Amanita inopinata Kibby_2008]
MALTQSARIPGPSWDEEVVPALRKRLEDESRTLARRISGMSLLSGEDHVNLATLTPREIPTHSTTTYAYRRSEDTYQRTHYQSPSSSSGLQGLPSSQPSNASNGKNSKSQRSRTLSQPFPPDAPRRKSSASRIANGSSRPSDTRPTRIPKSSRPTQIPSSHNNFSATHGVNGFGQLVNKASPSNNEMNHDTLASRDVPTISSRSTLDRLSRQVSGLLDEPAPFQTGSMSSASRSNHDPQFEEAPPRPSNDSEERPFEHWYRGEVSRNGGVGELRVGRRQEMLDIANYGHTIAKQQRENSRAAVAVTINDGRWRRKRADSVGRVGRDSVYLDDERARQIGRVLDESPPTDLDGEDEDDSDVESVPDCHTISAHRKYDSCATTTTATAGDLSTISESVPHSVDEGRSVTPTPAPVNKPPTHQQNGSLRMPAQSISSPRPSVDSRVATPVQMKRGLSEPPSTLSKSAPSTPRGHRQQSKGTPSSAQKRNVSPMPPAKKASAAAGKAIRPKAVKLKREMTAEEKRKSIAVYPLSVGDHDMADAIPSWTQPKPREGNWDEVVLPVVARKKGLEDHYEQADGSPQPKKATTMAVVPAPGTFGFDHSKYRSLQDADEIPMDEFGRPTQTPVEETTTPEREPNPPPEPVSTQHEELHSPVRYEPPPSPVPFADYAPNETLHVPMVAPPVTVDLDTRQIPAPHDEEEKDGAGCCKCVIM